MTLPEQGCWEHKGDDVPRLCPSARNPPSVEPLLAARVRDTRSKKSPMCELEGSGASRGNRPHGSISLSTWRVSTAQDKADECVGPVGVPGPEEPSWIQLPECSWGRPREASEVPEMLSLARVPSGSWALLVVWGRAKCAGTQSRDISFLPKTGMD